MLTSVENVKQWLGISATTDDALLTRLLTAASAFVEGYLNRTLASVSYTDSLDGNESSVQMFPNYPVTAVSSVSIDGISIPLATTVTANGYRFNSTKLMLNGYKFTRGLSNVVIVYTAGYSAIPDDIVDACIQLVGLRYREKDRIGQESKSLGGETTQFVTKDMTPAIRTALDQHKKVLML